MERKWQIRTADRGIVQQLRDTLKCHPVTATVLANRNFSSPAAARAFLNADLKDLRSPLAVKDMDRAVSRIHEAILREEKILIFGDYDVDGVTAVSLLLGFLQETGARVGYYVPHRISEGYGLNESHIREHAAPNGYRLLITVDCGIGSHEAVRAAEAAGIDVIITDHHQVSNGLPEALAVINPKRPDATDEFSPLAGVGVVYLLLICLRKHLREHGFWKERAEPNLKNACDLVALGTVADIVPMIAENRIFTRIGLDVMAATARPGIRALLAASAIRDPVNEEDIAFRLAPRINAAGRIGHARTAVALLTTTDWREAADLAAELNELNETRKSIEGQILRQIQERLMIRSDLNQRPALVLSDPDWHEGVLGIVAAKLVNRYQRPVILISTRSGTGKGSARSIPGFDLYEGLRATGEHLEGFGGHTGAAGLAIKPENVDRFTEHFEAVVREHTDPSLFVPVLTVDQELTFDQISPRLADELEGLRPYGEANPEPLFMARNLKVTFAQALSDTHWKMALAQPSAKTTQPLSAIRFNAGRMDTKPKYLEKIAFRLRWNCWNGKRNLQLLIEEIQ
jgi:single-stranded-DNA-specific exonuclease